MMRLGARGYKEMSLGVRGRGNIGPKPRNPKTPYLIYISAGQRVSGSGYGVGVTGCRPRN